ncbi:uncharacterized protein LOC142339353 isoform X4 [Convolutriloba macropyga]|uniref:uncharacterized protein LOC142339353 isoform X4 n=1 Tax=Convolutriloba macropyga TaxID=536237 RepID=UPI003F525D47
MTFEQSDFDGADGGFTRSGGTGKGVRRSIRAAGRFATNLTNSSSTAANMFQEKCCTCRFTIKHTQTFIKFHKQEWLPQKLGIVWHRKGKDDLRIDTARNYVPKPDDPFQGSAHFFDPAKSAYDYVNFDTGFILNTSSDQFLKKPVKVSIQGLNIQAPKHKQAKILGTGEVDLSTHAYEAYSQTSQKNLSGAASSTGSIDSTPSRLIDVKMVPKSEKVIQASLTIEVSCTLLAENVALDSSSDLMDTSSLSREGSNYDGLSVNSDFLDPLSESTNASPNVQNKLQRFPTMSPGDMKSRKAGTLNRVQSTLRYSFSSKEKQRQKRLQQQQSASDVLLPKTGRTASLSPARNAQIQYQLPSVSPKPRSQSVKPEESNEKDVKEIDKEGRIQPPLLIGSEEIEDGDDRSVDDSVPDIVEEVDPRLMASSQPSQRLIGRERVISEVSEENYEHEHSKESISINQTTNAQKKPTDTASAEIDLDATLSVDHSESTHDSQAANDIKPREVIQIAASSNKVNEIGESQKTLRNNEDEIVENAHVEDHPLKVMEEKDDYPTTEKVNPFLHDNAENRPFTSAECLMEKERAVEKQFEQWVSDVTQGYPRLSEETAICSLLSPEDYPSLDTNEAQLTSGITLCAVLHRYNPQLIGNFMWLLEENDSQAERFFKLAYLTCDTVSIPTDGFSEEQNPSTALQLLRRIHTHYIHQPIPPLPAECLTGIMGAGDAESEAMGGGIGDAAELRDLQRTEDIRNKMHKRQKASAQDRLSKLRMASEGRRSQKKLMSQQGGTAVELEDRAGGGDIGMSPQHKSPLANQILTAEPSLNVDYNESAHISNSEISYSSGGNSKPNQMTNKLESARSLMLSWGAKLKNRLEDSPQTHNRSSLVSTEKTSQDSKSNSLSKVAIKEPIVRHLEQDLVANEIKSGLLQFQNDEANDPSVIDQNDSRPSIDVGATNGMSEVRELNGDSNEQDSSVLFETEEEMCETLRRNWRTATAKQRLLVRNRQQEIENELNQLRDCIAKQVSGGNEEDGEEEQNAGEDEEGRLEAVIERLSGEMMRLTNEKSDLMLELDDIDIMEEDLDLQEKADQVKHQLRLLQLNKEVEGTEERENEEARLVQLFRSLMDERNALVEKVDQRQPRHHSIYLDQSEDEVGVSNIEGQDEETSQPFAGMFRLTATQLLNWRSNTTTATPDTMSHLQHHAANNTEFTSIFDNRTTASPL